MRTLMILIRRNIKMYFKDKGMFFTSMITPAILLFLYTTFLSRTYRDTFVSIIPEQFALSDDLLDALVSSQLVSSILAVSCITVAFCSNFLMVQDKANKTRKDFMITPVRPWILSMSYFIATLLSTLMICLLALGICVGYQAMSGWHMPIEDIGALAGDVVLLSLLGTAISSLINFFLSTQGQISAVSAIISAGYGFVCGAYMPMYSFEEGLRKILMYLPGSYGTSLVRNHSMAEVFSQMKEDGLPNKVINQLKDSLDCHLYFDGDKVSFSTMYMVLGLSILGLILIYIAINVARSKRT